ncbi:MAG: glycosyltransferase family 4 protein [Bacteroidetes bacterium]|nr:glycosyltransferase family 4 protein [Bacteroidota bacterium]
MFNRINIIIPVLGSSSWTGGFTYQSNLIEALRTRPDVSVFLVRNLDQSPDEKTKLKLPAKVIHFISQVRDVLSNKFSLLLRGYNKQLTHKLNRYTIAEMNVLFTHNNAHLLSKNDLLKLYWIPDFQHVHMSYFFSPDEISERNQRFLHGCEHADIVIVSSRNAQNDLANFAPQYLAKSRISNFVSNVPKGIWDIDPLQLISKYSVPEKFFYLPNQFWKHKNHMLVFEALNLLKSENIFPVIVCTGNPTDYRNPEYSNELKVKIEQWGLKDQLYILGLVDHSDVLLLIRQCIALINPSLFEGWSTTVEECKSIGKRAILSDIEVHKEQNPPLTDYFNPKDAGTLAEIIKKRWAELSPGPDLKLEEDAKANLHERMSNYANNFVSIIKKSYANRKIDE